MLQKCLRRIQVLVGFVPESKIVGIERVVDQDDLAITGSVNTAYFLKGEQGSVWYWRTDHASEWICAEVKGHVPWHFGFVNGAPHVFRLQGAHEVSARCLRESERKSVLALYNGVCAKIANVTQSM
jgi:hypothetical protein